MELALEQARAAALLGEIPVGCVLVGADGEELARAHNLRERDADPTAHAELLALRAAGRALGQWNLSGTTAYVTLEPCAMCAGALVLARVRRVVWAAEDPKAGAVRSLYAIGQDPRLNHVFEAEGGLCAPASAALLETFFRSLRA